MPLWANSVVNVLVSSRCLRSLRVVFSKARNFTVIASLMQTGTRLRWRNAMFYKRRFRIVRSDSLNLPVLSLLCAWERHLHMRTQRSQAMCTSVLPASKTLVYQKIYHLNTLHLYPAQTRKRTKKGLLNSYIKLSNYPHPIFRFLQKMRTWSRSKSL